ncbi:MAG: rod shape-determining protein [Clostridia bacterium]|nr:rod shape-determining protein [Clostridia bacterium]
MQKQKIVIDPGSSNLTIYGGGYLLREPNVCVIKRGNHVEIIAVGSDALKLTDLPENCSLIYPVKEGVVSRPDVFAKVLEYYLSDVIAFSLFSPVELYVLIPSGLSSAERENVESAVQRTGHKDITLIENVLGFLPILGSGDRAVCSFGGGTTEVAVINDEGIVSACTVNIGGNTINEGIIEQVLKTYSLRISNSTAEKLKVGVGSLYDNDSSVITITGQDVLDGKMKNVEISAESIRTPIVWCYKKIAELIESVLTTVPYSKIASVSANGLSCAGAGSNLRGLTDYLSKYLKLPVNIVAEPEVCAVKGAYELVTNVTNKYAMILGNKR